VNKPYKLFQFKYFDIERTEINDIHKSDKPYRIFNFNDSNKKSKSFSTIIEAFAYGKDK